MKKEIKLSAYNPNKFFDMFETEEANITNTDNYKDEYFIIEIGDKKYMFNKREFKIAIEDATNF